MDNFTLLYILISCFTLIPIFYSILIYRLSHDILHYGLIFSCIYILTFPFKLYLSTLGLAVLNPFIFDFKFIFTGLIFSFVGWFTFIVPSLMKYKKIFVSEKVNMSSFFSPALCCLFLFGLFVIIHKTNLFQIFNPAAIFDLRVDKMQNQQNSSFKAVLSSLLSVIIFLLYWGLLKRKKIGTVVFLFFTTSWITLILTTSKQDALLPVLLIIFLFHYLIKKFNFIKIIPYGIAFLFLLLFSAGLRALDASKLQFDSMFLQLSNAFDGIDNFISIISNMNNIWIGDSYGAKFLDYTIVGVTPRFIWPGKPALYGNLSIQKEYISYLFFGQEGMVVSPSFLGPSCIDFGLIGIIISCTLFGFLYNYFYLRFLNKKTLQRTFCYWVLLSLLVSFSRTGIGITIPCIMLFSSFFLIKGVYQILTKALYSKLTV